MRRETLLRLAWLLAAVPYALCGAELRLGIIGTDTSHVISFTRILNGLGATPGGVRVVAAFKGGSQDIESSASRVDKYAEELRAQWGVEIVPSIPALLAKVDGVLLTSVDGRVHLEQARLAIAAHKPLFIDKPLAATLEDAREIARLAQEQQVPWFSSSSLRFSPTAERMRSAGNQGAVTWGPGPFEPHHYLDLSWYAIHPVELLYTLMGPGCETVSRISGADAEVVVGRWKDGRIGVVRALRPYGGYGIVVYRSQEIVQSPIEKTEASDYRPLVAAIVKFFETREPPVSNRETLEIFAFLDAAQRSKEVGGSPVTLR